MKLRTDRQTSKDCFFCGNGIHERSMCPAKGVTCAACGKLDHLKPVCRNTAKTGKTSKRHHEVHESDIFERVPRSLPGTIQIPAFRRMEHFMKLRTERQTSADCFFCGNGVHERSMCPAKGVTCAACGKLDHLKPVCRNTAKTGKTSKKHHEVYESDIFERFQDLSKSNVCLEQSESQLLGIWRI